MSWYWKFWITMPPGRALRPVVPAFGFTVLVVVSVAFFFSCRVVVAVLLGLAFLVGGMPFVAPWVGSPLQAGRARAATADSPMSGAASRVENVMMEEPPQRTAAIA